MTKSSDYLLIAKRLFDRQHSIQHIADMIGVHRSTIYRWKESSWKPFRAKRPRKLSTKLETAFCDSICTQPTISQHTVVEKVFEATGIKVSQPYISRMLQRQSITYKRATTHFEEQKPGSISLFLMSQRPDPVTWLALDECSFTLNFAPTYAYSKRGSRAVVSRPGSRGQRISLILCISANGVVHHEWQQGGVNALRFQQFFHSLPENATIVMDNASTHHAFHTLKNKGVLSIRETADLHAQTIVYLPPYSPQLNPTELCFNVLKGMVRKKRPRSLSQLKALVHDTLKTTSMSAFFHHCWKSPT
jgi:transposase